MRRDAQHEAQADERVRRALEDENAFYAPTTHRIRTLIMRFRRAGYQVRTDKAKP
jgi:hypothetical protein